jgi:MFS family permease
LAVEGLASLILCEVALICGTSLWTPLLNIYFDALNFPVVSIGLISTTQGILSTITMMPAGIISDRIGRKQLIVLSYLLTLLYAVALVFVRDYYVVLAASAVQGVAVGLRGAIVGAYVADRVAPDRRGMAFASVSFFQSSGSILATAMGSYIASSYGFTLTFQIGAVVLLGTVILAALTLRESFTAAATDRLRTGLLASFIQAVGLFRDRRLGLLLVLGFNLLTVGLLLNARRIGDMVGKLPSGKLIDRFGGEFAIFLHVLLTAPIIYLYTLTNNLYLIALIFLIWGSEAGWDIPSRRLLVIKFSEGVGTATALGAAQTFIGLMTLPAPTIGGGSGTPSARPQCFRSAPSSTSWRRYHSSSSYGRHSARKANPVLRRGAAAGNRRG